jgi:type III pantothenate kinase
MLLCLDIGNSHVCGGVFDQDELLLQFRYDSRHTGTSDEFGVFIRSVLKENAIDYRELTRVGIASVVPAADYSIRAACIKYLNLQPLFLQPGIKTGIVLKTQHVNEVGADLVASAIAAKALFPKQNMLIFDLGTATTCCFLSMQDEFLGVSIAPGIRLMMDALQNNTAKLFEVDIAKPELALGKNTKMAIQSGIYYAQVGLVQQLIGHAINEHKLTEPPLILATGGFSHLLNNERVFDYTIPELVLLGVKCMLELNQL